MATLEGLQWCAHNTVLTDLPVDSSYQNEPRQVPGAIMALVRPTPLREPVLVAASAEALELLGLDPKQVRRRKSHGVALM